MAEPGLLLVDLNAPPKDRRLAPKEAWTSPVPEAPAPRATSLSPDVPPDTAEARQFVWFVPLTVLLCSVHFILALQANEWKFMSFQENILLGPSVSALLEMGGSTSVHVLNGREFWRLPTSIYLHAGVFHLVL